MLKTLKNILRSERELFKVTKSVQQSIPIKRIYKDGTWQVGKKYSKTFRFADINYAVAGHEEQLDMFLDYCAVINALPTDATTKITIVNRKINPAEFERDILMPLCGDGLDNYRIEYNNMLIAKSEAQNGIIQEKYITISAQKRGIEEAGTFFVRVYNDLITRMGKLSSAVTELSNSERLRLFHDFFRQGEEAYFRFDLSETMRKGHDFRDYICPDGMKFSNGHFEMGGKFGRVLFLREYASYIKDTMIAELCEVNRNLMLSIDLIPVPTDEAVKEIQTQIMKVETNITQWQHRQNLNNNYSATIPYDMEQQRRESKEFFDDITTRDQRMMFATVTLVHTADT